MLAGWMFYLFSAVLVASSVLAVTVRGPVQSVLFLILAFFNAAGLFLLAGAEFLAFILLILYVGAVAVLFLFVVMMLAAGQEDRERPPIRLGRLELLICFVLLAQMITLAWGGDWISAKAVPSTDNMRTVFDVRAIGRLLYTDYFLPFQTVGVLLVVAMVGAISLTDGRRKTVKRQDVTAQMKQSKASVLDIKKVKTGEGVG